MTYQRPSRRRFLQGAGAVGAISVAEWLGFFRNEGVPGTPKDWGIAKARAQAEEEERFLIYWNLEGGWDSYSMLSPVHTPTHSALSIPANTLNPTPAWSEHIYRARDYGTGDRAPPTTVSGIEHGYLAAGGRSLFPDMCVVEAFGNTFHSGGRFDMHYGTYNRPLGGIRQPDERTVMQAFAEAKGASFLLPHLSWHRWLSDGELDFGQFPAGTGYAENLGPAYAHTVYGRTPRELKARLRATGDVATQARRGLIREYADNIRARFLNGRDGQSMRAFASAADIHRTLSAGGSNLDLTTLFEDPELKAAFGVTPADELTTATSVNGNPARSKESPHIKVQAMMTYEMMRAKASCAFFLETREVRGWDSHRSRNTVLNQDGNSDQLNLVQNDLWNPLTTLVNRLKTTELLGSPGVSLYDRTTIVITSEMGRTIQGNVDQILASTASTEEKYAQILDQDVCQHWHVSSVAFMGGSVRGGTQYGRVGTTTLDHIPIMPNGTLDPAYNATTGVLQGTKAPTSFVPNFGNIYATALQLAGVNPAGKGRNNRPPLSFVPRTT